MKLSKTVSVLLQAQIDAALGAPDGAALGAAPQPAAARHLRHIVRKVIHTV